MFDFLGAVQMHDRPVNGKCQPFKHLSDIEKIRFSETKLTLDSQCWWLLHNGKEPAMFERDHIRILLHGNCYPNLYSGEKGHKRKLTAEDLANRYMSGADMMRSVKGSFVIVVINQERKSVELFTDPLNIRTAYYSSIGGNLIISTSLTAIGNYFDQSGYTTDIDRRAILDHYLFDFTLDDHTYLKGVLEVGPGSHLLLLDGKLTVSTYFNAFNFFALSGSRLNWADGAEQVKSVLSDNIQLYNEGPDDTAVALTGGFDSRSIAALLGESIKDYTFFSYGKRQSWDVKIPQKIAERLQLKYQPIFLEDDYVTSFSEYANLAVILSEGTAEFSHANIPYVYSSHLLDKTSILTGLFGSELIKTPSSRGLFLDNNSIKLLDAQDPVVAVQSIFDQLDAHKVTLSFYNKETREETIEMVRSLPFISNDLPLNEKYFFYVLMVGARKYFRKETKIQRYWKTNLHPFFDVELIAKLLETSFPWVYNFSAKKSLVRNIGTHKLYSLIINENRILGDIISTHGYRPRLLLSPVGTLQVAVEYYLNKKKFSNESTLNFQEALSLKLIGEDRDHAFTNAASKPTPWNESMRPKDFIKMTSLQNWYWLVGLEIDK